MNIKLPPNQKRLDEIATEREAFNDVLECLDTLKARIDSKRDRYLQRLFSDAYVKIDTVIEDFIKRSADNYQTYKAATLDRALKENAALRIEAGSMFNTLMGKTVDELQASYPLAYLAIKDGNHE